MEQTGAAKGLDPNLASQGAGPDLLWIDVRELTIEGKGWWDTETFYDRWPARARQIVPDIVWQLGQRTAGIAARFVTDSQTIAARWTLRFPDLQMDRMPATGVSGLDLYTKHGHGWRWIGVGREPKFPQSEATLASELRRETREYRLYLPLYNGVEAASIGVEPDAKVSAASASDAAPLCFYGTSIVQGACASRPGMAYPAIVGRQLNRPAINLGLSGSARCEPELAELVAELEPAAYVLDCLPNMQAAQVTERMPAFVHAIRAAGRSAPIVLVENIPNQREHSVPRLHERRVSSNAALREVYDALRADGVRMIYYVPCDNLLGRSGDASVDGTHPSDVGMLALAGEIGRVVQGALDDAST